MRFGMCKGVASATLYLFVSMAPFVSAQEPATEADRKELLESATRFCERLGKTMSAGEATLYDESFDADAFHERVTRGLELSPAFGKAVRRSIGSMRFGKKTIEETAQGGLSYKLLRVRENPLRGVFRMISQNGLNYEELELTRSADGSFGIADMYVFATGETVSAEIRRNVLRAAIDNDRSLIDRLTGRDGLFLKHTEDFSAMRAKQVERDFAGSLEILQGLPKPLRNLRHLMILRVRIAGMVGTDEYTKACDAFLEALPGDPSVNLMLLDYQLEKKEFGRYQRMVDELESSIGGADPMLDVMRASGEIEAGMLEEAKTRLLGAIEAEPGLGDAHLFLLSLSVRMRDHELTARCLTTLEKDFGYEWPDLTKSESYAEFVKSPAYEAWKKR